MTKYDRILAVGDIHGCLDPLERMLDLVYPTEDDLMVFLGDYVDRGADSFKVIERLIALKEQFPQTVFIRGNHEDLFMRFLSDDGSGYNMEAYTMFIYNGGKATLRSYERELGNHPKYFKDLPPTHLKFFRETKFMHVEGDYVFVHGGLLPGFPLEEQEPHDQMWIRDAFLYNVEYDFGKIIAHGHTPMEEEEMAHYHELHKGKRFNLDTGCVFGYELTCVDVLSGEKYVVSNRRPRLER